MKVLITGAAGFIGYHFSRFLAEKKIKVVGIDNINDYYDRSLKLDRLKNLEAIPHFSFYKMDISHRGDIEKLFEDHSFTHVVNLAAQAGVRYSLTNPHSYVNSNQLGFLNILEGCRHNKIGHLLFASSSSVYGLNTSMPFSTSDNTDHPVSLYAATKKSNEMMAHAYSHLYKIPCTGLRFFTVYGPWGRPDMALYIFSKAILEDREIPLFNHGNMQRDFTYIDDIVEGMYHCLKQTPQPDSAWDSFHPNPAISSAPYRLYNIGNNTTVSLKHFVETLEKALGKRAKINSLPMQAGDVKETYANIDPLVTEFGFRPQTSIEEGIARFVDWYKGYYKT